MSDAPEILLKFKVASEGRELEFATLEQFENWNNSEAKFWHWLTQQGNPFSGRGTEHASFHTNVRNAINQFRPHVQDEGLIIDFRRRIGSLFENFYNKKHHRLSDSPEGRFLGQQLAKGGPGYASGTYAALFDLQEKVEPATYIWEGFLDGFLFKHNVSWSADVHQEKLKDLENVLEAQLQSHASEVRNFALRTSELSAAAETSRTSWEHEAADQLAAQQQEFTNLRSRHEVELKSIETTYNAKIALQAPVKYWKAKEHYHQKRVLWFSIATAGAFIATGVGLLLMCHWLFNVSEKSEIKHWQLGMGIIVGFFAIWVVRIFVRILFSHIHLASDAAERQVIVQTYLALSLEGQEFTVKEKDIILTQLFRPASDGIVKDDAAPAGLLEILSRK